MIALGILAVPLTPAALAQGTPGALLIYGNFCGPGEPRPGATHRSMRSTSPARITTPARRDGIPDACRAAPATGDLQVESSLIARDPRTPQQTRDMATFIANFAGSAQCQ